MWLKLKIFLNYTLLIILLGTVIYLFRMELIKRNELRKEGQELLAAHHLVERSYTHLLKLSSYAETAITWNDAELEHYGIIRREICDSLQLLKKYVHIPEQQVYIDSLCLLLKKKEELLVIAMRRFRKIQNISFIVEERIPAIVSTVRERANVQYNDKTVQKDTTEKKKNRWKIPNIFQRRKKQSAYLQEKQRIEHRKLQNIEMGSTHSATQMLQSLNNKISLEQERNRELMASQMDSIYINGIKLNHKLNCLVSTFEQELNGKFTKRYESSIRERDKSYYAITDLSIFVSLLTILLYMVIHRDLNRRQRYEKELESSNEANRELLQSKKDMMLAIAHDLRSPLTTISGSADLLSGEEDGLRKVKYVENIRHASAYMLSLVNTLMDFYLLDTGQTQSYACIFHLESLFKETADNYAPLTQRKNLRLSTCFSGTNVVVYGYKGYLQQIVNNLLSNAVKFTKEGNVWLEAEYRNGELHLSVRDTGTGMDGKDAEKIFTAFERLENARSVSGFGLGLAICSRLVSQMGGSIRVESWQGKGSDFIVLLPLPLADAESPLETEKLSSGLHMEGTHVLLLDDDFRQLGIVREMLRRHHAVCDCCQDSSELISKLRENKYDVLLMDIRMPEMDGFAVLELLRRSNILQARAIPAIALTALMDDDNEYLSRGFAGCIRKPFTMESLTEGVAKVVGKMKDEERGPDFSLILADEDNRREMLEVFITESRKDLSKLHKALEKDDRQAVCDILHKNLPLWDAVRLDFPIAELRRIITTPPFSWTAEDLARIHEIEGAADRLLSYAINMQKEEE